MVRAPMPRSARRTSPRSWPEASSPARAVRVSCPSCTDTGPLRQSPGQTVPAIEAGRVRPEIGPPARRADLHPFRRRCEWALVGLRHGSLDAADEREDDDEDDPAGKEESEDRRLVHARTSRRGWAGRAPGARPAIDSLTVRPTLAVCQDAQWSSTPSRPYGAMEGATGARGMPGARSAGARMPAVTVPTAATGYRLTEEQLMLRDAVRLLATERIAPRPHDIHRTAEFPRSEERR